jgi:transposase
MMIRGACRQFIALCRRLDLFTYAVAAIDGSKFKAAGVLRPSVSPASTTTQACPGSAWAA